VDESGVAHFVGAARRSVRLQLEAPIVDSLPLTDYPASGERSYRSCAIVGNSGTLLGAAQGPEVSDSCLLESPAQCIRSTRTRTILCTATRTIFHIGTIFYTRVVFYTRTRTILCTRTGTVSYARTFLQQDCLLY
jgi:hypothetical protein